MILKDKIMNLRSIGMSYREIQKRLNCSKGTISYYLGDGQKNKTTTRRRKNRQLDINILKHKMDAFKRSKQGNNQSKNSIARINKIINNKICHFVKEGENMTRTFTIKEVIEKIGDTPKCYLTGQPINLSQSNMYHFDHIVPKALGGDNTIENLGICISKANMAKSDMSLDEFFDLCKMVLENNGFDVLPKEST